MHLAGANFTEPLKGLWYLEGSSWMMHLGSEGKSLKAERIKKASHLLSVGCERIPTLKERTRHRRLITRKVTDLQCYCQCVTTVLIFLIFIVSRHIPHKTKKFKNSTTVSEIKQRAYDPQASSKLV